jgi:hypothetical protein
MGFINKIEYVTIASRGDTTDFGDLSGVRGNGGGSSSGTRGVMAGGRSPTFGNVIEYITIASTGDMTDFGDLAAARSYLAGASTHTRAIFGGGATPTFVNTIEYITIASTGDASDFGDLTVARRYLGALSNGAGGLATDGLQRTSATYLVGSGRGIAMGGYNAPAPTNTVELIHIPTLGNTSDFGDMHTAIAFGAANSSETRTIMQGGYNDELSTEVDQIQYVEHATSGTGGDFGNLLSTRANIASTGSCSKTRGLSEGGGAGGSSVVNEIEYITMATLGNAQDFGNLTVARELGASCSNGTRGVTAGG